MKQLDGNTIVHIADLIYGAPPSSFKELNVISDKNKYNSIKQFFEVIGINLPSLQAIQPESLTNTIIKILTNLNEADLPLLEKLILYIPNERRFITWGRDKRIAKELVDLNKILFYEGLEVDTKAVTPFIRYFDPEIKLQSQDLQEVGIIDFSKVTDDKDLEIILVERWDEVAKDIRSQAHISAITMLGSILEAVLLSMVLENKADASRANSAPKERINEGTRERMNVRKFEDWKFQELIIVAHEVGWIKQDIKHYVDILRDYRNFIHPNKQKTEKYSPSLGGTNICLQIVKHSINDLNAYRASHKSTSTRRRK